MTHNCILLGQHHWPFLFLHCYNIHKLKLEFKLLYMTGDCCYNNYFGGNDMKPTQLIEAVERKCRACRWWSPDDWRKCRNRQCPLNELVRMDVDTLSVSNIVNRLHDVCYECAPNQEPDTCSACPFSKFEFAPQWIVEPRQTIRLIRRAKHT